MTPRYKLRTLLILLAILPPLLWIGWGKYEAWRAEQVRTTAAQKQQLQAEQQMLQFRAAERAALMMQARIAELQANADAAREVRPKAPAKSGN